MANKKLIIKNSKPKNEQNLYSVHVYKGFSSNRPSQNFKVYDFDCIRQDIINQFNTRKGERVMNPNFGTIIWDAIFEPMIESTKTAVSDDIRRILKSEPRIDVEDVKVDEYESGILVEITVKYKTTDLRSVIKLSFDKQVGLIAS